MQFVSNDEIKKALKQNKELIKGPIIDFEKEDAPLNQTLPFIPTPAGVVSSVLPETMSGFNKNNYKTDIQNAKGYDDVVSAVNNAISKHEANTAVFIGDDALKNRKKTELYTSISDALEQSGYGRLSQNKNTGKMFIKMSNGEYKSLDDGLAKQLGRALRDNGYSIIGGVVGLVKGSGAAGKIVGSSLGAGAGKLADGYANSSYNDESLNTRQIGEAMAEDMLLSLGIDVGALGVAKGLKTLKTGANNALGLISNKGKEALQKGAELGESFKQIAKEKTNPLQGGGNSTDIPIISNLKDANIRGAESFAFKNYENLSNDEKLAMRKMMDEYTPDISTPPSVASKIANISDDIANNANTPEFIAKGAKNISQNANKIHEQFSNPDLGNRAKAVFNALRADESTGGVLDKALISDREAAAGMGRLIDKNAREFLDKNNLSIDNATKNLVNSIDEYKQGVKSEYKNVTDDILANMEKSEIGIDLNKVSDVVRVMKESFNNESDIPALAGRIEHAIENGAINSQNIFEVRRAINKAILKSDYLPATNKLKELKEQIDLSIKNASGKNGEALMQRLYEADKSYSKLKGFENGYLGKRLKNGLDDDGLSNTFNKFINLTDKRAADELLGMPPKIRAKFEMAGISSLLKKAAIDLDNDKIAINYSQVVKAIKNAPFTSNEALRVRQALNNILKIHGSDYLRAKAISEFKSAKLSQGINTNPIQRFLTMMANHSTNTLIRLLPFLEASKEAAAIHWIRAYLKAYNQDELIKELAKEAGRDGISASEKATIKEALADEIIYQQKADELLKQTKKEKRGIFNTTYNEKKATYIKTDLNSIDNTIRYEREGKEKGAKHVQLRHTKDPKQTGYVSKEEVTNLGNSIRKFLKEHKEPFKDKNGADIYEWENAKGVRFRLVADKVRDGTTPELPQPDLVRQIITFYSDRNLKERMKFKNPKLNTKDKEYEFTGLLKDVLDGLKKQSLKESIKYNERKSS